MGEVRLNNEVQCATPDGSMRMGTLVESIDGKEYRFKGTYVCMGNPHFVIFVEDISKIELAKVGPLLECNPVFPERCNIEFAQLLDNGTIRMRVWERGSGITLACGTGGCATSVAATLTQGMPKTNTILMDGGSIKVDWEEDNHIYMTGPAVSVFEGEIRAKT